MNLSNFDMIIQEFYPIYNVMVWYFVIDQANDDFVCLVEIYLNLQYFLVDDFLQTQSHSHMNNPLWLHLRSYGRASPRPT
jgi:hypothetical protein